MKIEIYTKSGCGACNALKTLVETDYSNVFSEIVTNIIQENTTVEELTERLGFKPRAVPQVFINDKYIGGVKATHSFLQNLTK